MFFSHKIFVEEAVSGLITEFSGKYPEETHHGDFHKI